MLLISMWHFAKNQGYKHETLIVLYLPVGKYLYLISALEIIQSVFTICF